jgi:octaprenyl-diphosphate synthase
MNTSPQLDGFNLNHPQFERFESEIHEVQSTLLAATTDLIRPLGDLVRAQIKRSQPPICGATVLAVSMPNESTPEDTDLRRKRILLAAALEMLHVALNVHRLLVNATRDGQYETEQQENHESLLDRSFIGSTILAGDYCFSRAAQMAAQTDHPRVVATFSTALQTVSEELLREQFHTGNGSYDEIVDLLQSGAHAAALLVDLPENEQQQAVALSQELAARWTLGQLGKRSSERQTTTIHTDTLPPSWQALYHWLNFQRANGESPSTTPQYS